MAALSSGLLCHVFPQWITVIPIHVALSFRTEPIMLHFDCMGGGVKWNLVFDFMPSYLSYWCATLSYVINKKREDRKAGVNRW